LGDQVLCDATGLCVDPAPGMTKAPDPAKCSPGYTVRQGGTINIPVPVASLDAVMNPSTSSDLQVGQAKLADDGSIVVPVTAAHGAPSGDGDFGPGHRIVTITTMVDGQPVTRHVLVVVSHLVVSTPTASSPGSDDNAATDGHAGTIEAPFATLQTAIMWAAKGDTIELANFFAGPDPEQYCSMPLGATINLPPGTTLIGRDMLPTHLPMTVTLDGDAVLQNIELTGKRLDINSSGSYVQIFNSKLHCGVTVDSAADINPKTNVPTRLLISGGATNIWNDLHFDNNIRVDAAGAQVTLDDHANIVITGMQTDTTSATPAAPGDTIVLAGDAQSLTILGGTRIENASGAAAIRLMKRANAVFEGADVTGPLIVEDPASSVQISTSTFEGPATAIEFHGKEMSITGTTFGADGIIQDNPTSKVTVEAMMATSFKQFGYWLKDGTATISDSTFARSSVATLSQMGPWALIVDAPATSAGNITSSSSKYDVAPPPAPCTIAGPPWDASELPGLYSIGQPTPTRDTYRIAFY
jgi:hypothetical protein